MTDFAKRIIGADIRLYGKAAVLKAVVAFKAAGGVPETLNRIELVLWEEILADVVKSA